MIVVPFPCHLQPCKGFLTVAHAALTQQVHITPPSGVIPFHCPSSPAIMVNVQLCQHSALPYEAGLSCKPHCSSCSLLMPVNLLFSAPVPVAFLGKSALNSQSAKNPPVTCSMFLFLSTHAAVGFHMHWLFD